MAGLGFGRLSKAFWAKEAIGLCTAQGAAPCPACRSRKEAQSIPMYVELSAAKVVARSPQLLRNLGRAHPCLRREG